MLNVAMPQIVFQRSRVSAAVGQVKPGRMAQHMGMHLDPDAAIAPARATSL
jgi:hypothetical protein